MGRTILNTSTYPPNSTMQSRTCPRHATHTLEHGRRRPPPPLTHVVPPPNAVHYADGMWHIASSHIHVPCPFPPATAATTRSVQIPSPSSIPTLCAACAPTTLPFLAQRPTGGALGPLEARDQRFDLCRRVDVVFWRHSGDVHIGGRHLRCGAGQHRACGPAHCQPERQEASKRQRQRLPACAPPGRKAMQRWSAGTRSWGGQVQAAASSCCYATRRSLR
jgi:hypothetical protein